MNDDGVRRLVLGLGAGQAAHLQTVLGIGQRVLVGHFGQAQRLVAHAQTGCVHHHKHGLQALVGLAHHFAHSAVHHDLGGGVGLDAHLVFQTAAVDGVALTQRAIGVHLVLGHDEQADALGACR